MTKNDSLKKVATGISPTPLGIGFQTENKALAKLVADTLASMKADGSYDAVLKTWGIESAALK